MKGMASVLRLLGPLSRLRSRQLAAIAAVLFLGDLFIPDPLPLLDEGVLGLLALWLSRREGSQGPVSRRAGTEGR
ncbi:MAG: hypothetical protein O2930_08510 [Acidobacteria bacterium]|nr:hypothetical protein [Acidobacteriota bacterium]